jgi:outer membrane protein OmpA-like peptidoglycan-associated protein
MKSLKFKQKENEDNSWLHISDMMSGLMMVFLFISISYMITVLKEKNRIKEIAVTYEKLQNNLYDELLKEFKKDLDKWDAEIVKQSLSVKFKSPDILFRVGSDELQPRFKEILNDFFPRYIKILTQSRFKNEIEEIRIEGHTSSEWSEKVLPEITYFNNMKLSQDRTRSVLEFVSSNYDIQNQKSWMRNLITANGLSSSKLILNSDGAENAEKSRRVEFRVRTNAETRIVKILEESQQ